MADDESRRMPPGLAVIFGMVLVLVGLWLAREAAAIRVGAVAGAPRCTTEFAKGCITERAAVLEKQDHTRHTWWTREQQWLLRVPAGAPGLYDAERLALDVPRQDGRVGLAEGTEVTVVYFGRDPAWIWLPSGAVLETGQHPRREAPLMAWFALFALGLGSFAIRLGIRSGRRGGWLRPTSARAARVGPDVVLALAGMLGTLGHLWAGGTVWPGVTGVLLGLGVGVLAWRGSRRRRAAHA
jgi:hypothetical protein